MWIEETYSDWKDRILTKGEESHSKLLKDTVLKNSDALFINFNYTKTLEDLYRIPEKQVFHLHGVIDGGKFIFGHGFDDELSDFNPLDVGAYLEEVVIKLKNQLTMYCLITMNFLKDYLLSKKFISSVLEFVQNKDG